MEIRVNLKYFVTDCSSGTYPIVQNLSLKLSITPETYRLKVKTFVTKMAFSEKLKSHIYFKIIKNGSFTFGFNLSEEHVQLYKLYLENCL